ncbi:MAG: class I SAM-dependent methyltransferase [Dehalococcoidia bacterium]|jgi:SAM-dependent methyltransferase|nr:class I SAM-dependent methyltransferase [Dehalococcoidia bacterium]
MTLPGDEGVEDPGAIVRRGYDLIARTYHAQRGLEEDRERLDEFAGLLPRGARVLDTGCGAGVPVARFLAGEGFEVTGIDVSESMLELAREHVPAATFRLMDMTELDFADGSFEGLTACYSIFHVPRELHASLLSAFHRLLVPGGVMLVSLGHAAWEGTEPDFHGTRMFWSHFGPDEYARLLANAGFELLWGKFGTGEERHYWALARNGG